MTNDHLDVVMVQENPILGDLDANRLTISHYLSKFPETDLIIFPECFLTGYPLGDLVLRPGFLSDVDNAIGLIQKDVTEKNGPSVIIGAPMAGTHLPYNAAYLIEPNGSVRIVRKTELPNSDVFDEVRTFARGSEDDIAPLPFKGFNLGLLICEDMWHGRVTRKLADEMADIFIVINGSPYNHGKINVRLDHARRRVTTNNLPLLYCNLVGGQDELVFDGGSFAMNVDGSLIHAAAFKPYTTRLEFIKNPDGKVRIKTPNDTILGAHPYPRDERETDYQACVLGLRDYVLKNHQKQVFIGISGGLDSALVATMAVDALGSEFVTGMMLPTRYTGNESLSLAALLMQNLTIHDNTLSIENTFNAIHNDLMPVLQCYKNPDISTMDENLQARTRGMILMAMSNALGGIVLSTGNKSEMAVGYATLYGDMCGGFNPLKSIYKSKAFEMAKWRNEIDPRSISDFARPHPIPDGIITRPPTAELKDDQQDTNSLGEYVVLDLVLETLIEDKLGIFEATMRLKHAFEPDDLLSKIPDDTVEVYVERIAKLVRIAQYKRHQSPPGVKVNPVDFGPGWRYPITGNYHL